MREIKFRVWNTNLNRFMCEDEKNDNYMDVTTGKLVSNCYAVHEYGNATEYYNDGSYKLLQYTGLKDKNGVEIYEGDILARCFDDYDEHCEVFYDYAICSVRTLKSKAVRPLNIKANKNGCGWCNVDGGSSCYDFRVIGNIYQNHELLEQIKCGS